MKNIIIAVISYIQPETHNRNARAFAFSDALVSPENPKGEIVFYASDWTDESIPYIGQRISVGQTLRNARPHSGSARWRGYHVRPVWIASHPQALPMRPMQESHDRWWMKLLSALGLRSRPRHESHRAIA